MDEYWDEGTRGRTDAYLLELMSVACLLGCSLTRGGGGPTIPSLVLLSSFSRPLVHLIRLLEFSSTNGRTDGQTTSRRWRWRRQQHDCVWLARGRWYIFNEAGRRSYFIERIIRRRNSYREPSRLTTVGSSSHPFLTVSSPSANPPAGRLAGLAGG